MKASGSRSEGEPESSSSLDGKRHGVSKYRIFIVLFTVIYETHRNERGTKIKTVLVLCLKSNIFVSRFGT